MSLTSGSLLNSKYFTPIFNTAIFDGPIRLYFSGPQEPEALKLYLQIREFFEGHGWSTTEDLNEDKKVFVLLYPDSETFNQAFDSAEMTCSEPFGEDAVVGIRGPFEDRLTDIVLQRVSQVFSLLKSARA